MIKSQDLLLVTCGAFGCEWAGESGGGLDLLWDTWGPACERSEFERINGAIVRLVDAIERDDVDPEPMTMLGVLVITLPGRLVLPARPRLYALTCELFDEWEWDKEELEGLE